MGNASVKYHLYNQVFITTNRLQIGQVDAGVPERTLNARKHYQKRRRRVPPVVLDGASSGLWFDGWKGRGPPPGRFADADRSPEVAALRTWLLSKGWRRSA